MSTVLDIVKIIIAVIGFFVARSDELRDQKQIKDVRKITKTYHVTSRKEGRKRVQEAMDQLERSEAEAREALDRDTEAPDQMTTVSGDPTPETPEMTALLVRCKRMDELIKLRFETGELTAVRYRLVLDQVRLGMLSNLDRQRQLKASVAHLDRDQIDSERVGEADPDRMRILTERVALLDDVEDRIKRMQTANEQALHTLDRAIVVLTDLAEKDGQTSGDFQAYVADLESLVSRAHRTASGAGQLDEIEIEESPQLKKPKNRKTVMPGAS